jgi:hypothetical protein
MRHSHVVWRHRKNEREPASSSRPTRQKAWQRQAGSHVATTARCWAEKSVVATIFSISWFLAMHTPNDIVALEQRRRAEVLDSGDWKSTEGRVCKMLQQPYNFQSIRIGRDTFKNTKRKWVVNMVIVGRERGFVVVWSLWSIQLRTSC